MAVLFQSLRLRYRKNFLLMISSRKKFIARFSAIARFKARSRPVASLHHNQLNGGIKRTFEPAQAHDSRVQ
jgi:hypothetical protein